MKKISSFLFILLFFFACAPAPTQTSEVLPTATPLPSTATSTYTPEPPTSTPTATPIPLPANVMDVLQAYPGYAMVDDDKNGTSDRIVLPNGDTLFKFVPPEERYDPSIEWQRYETFTLTDGSKLEMPRFEAFDDALLYVSKHAFWRRGANWMRQVDFWTSFDNPNGSEFFSKIKKIPGSSPYTGFISPSNSDKFVLLHLDKIGNKAFLLFEPEENLFEIIFVNESAESFASLDGTHSVPTPQP